MNLRARAAIDHTIDVYEGSYVDNKKDPGGETNFGISSKTYKDIDIKNLKREQAVEIYFRDYWEPNRCGEMPAGIGEKVFDISVNCGRTAAAKMLQRALKACGMIDIVDDGIIGDKTMGTLKKADPLCVKAALTAEHAAYYRALVDQRPELLVFINGWLNRAYGVSHETNSGSARK